LVPKLLIKSSFDRILREFSSSFSVFSGVPQGSALGPLLFKIFINDISAKIDHSKILLFADDLKVYRNSKSAEDFKALQVDTDTVQQWWSENGMEFNIQKAKMISFTRKSISIHFKHFVKDVLILRAQCIKDTGVMADSKLYFHCRVDLLYSQARRTSGLIRFIAYIFSSLDSLVVLYIALIRFKLKYASVVWNKLTLTDSNKTEYIKIKFANLCYYHFFQFGLLRNYDSILSDLNFRKLYSRRRHLDGLFLINIFKGKINLHSIIHGHCWYSCAHKANKIILYFQREQCIKK
jgi:hypothetical protein